MCRITQAVLLKEFSSATIAIGDKNMGFDPEDIGKHSGISAVEMIMFLDNVLIFLVMLAGRWSSYTLLNYIIK